MTTLATTLHGLGRLANQTKRILLFLCHRLEQSPPLGVVVLQELCQFVHIPVCIHVNVRFIVHKGSITGGLQLLECGKIAFQLVVLGQCGLGEGLEEELLGFDVGEVAGWLGRVWSGVVEMGLGGRVSEGWGGLLGCGCHSF